MNLSEIITKNPCDCGETHEIVTKKIQIQKNITPDIIDFIKNNFGDNAKGCIICDENTHKASLNMLWATTAPGMCKAVTLDIKSHHADEFMVADCENILENKSFDYFIACGSGTIHDITRIVAHKKNKPFISYPTAPSVDGFVSVIAPITTKDGMKISFPAVAPIALFADIDVLAAAPQRLAASGAGDILAKYIALTDWRISHLLTGEYICEPTVKFEYAAIKKVKDSIFELRRNTQSPLLKGGGGEADGGLPSSLRETSDSANPRPSGTPFQKGAYEKFCADLLEALVISGLCMQYTGNSRPASGAEHHIAHFFEMGTILSTDCLHGENVGIGSVLCADLYHRFAKSDNIKFIENYDIDKDLIKKYYANIYDEIIKENAPNSVKNVTPEIFYGNIEKIKEIIAEIPSVEEFNEVFDILGGVRNVSELNAYDLKCGEDEIAPLALKLAPYIRNRLTLLKLMRCIEF